MQLQTTNLIPWTSLLLLKYAKVSCRESILLRVELCGFLFRYSRTYCLPLTSIWREATYIATSNHKSDTLDKSLTIQASNKVVEAWKQGYTAKLHLCSHDFSYHVDGSIET